MPKSYSESERKQIIESLQHHAAECLSTYGIKRTTVDELERRAKIPKGTFYLFYPSKEILLFQVIQTWHDNIQNELLEAVASYHKKITSLELSRLLYSACTSIEKTGLLPLLNNGELESLMRKLPPEVVHDHQSHDEDTITKLFELLPVKGGQTISHYSAAFRAIFLTMLYKTEIGDAYEEAFSLLLHGLCIQLLGGESID